VPDIVKQKLALVDLGATDVEARLSDAYAARDFVVEYKETDVAFVSRLTEHLGVSFFFETRDGKDVLVLGDSPSAFRPAPGAERLPFRPRGEATGVFALEKKREIMPAMWVVQDYNYRLPRVDLTSTDEVHGAYAGGVVEYGAHVKTPAESAALAKARAEEREAACRYFVGESDRTELAAGATFVLEGHPRLPGDQALLVVEVEHRLVQVVGTFGGKQVEHYKNTFRAVDASTRYRPPRTTPRPKIHGVVTALVEPKADGTLGSVADIDDWGRYTIRFYFDTSPLGERQKSSHAVRMIQQHAGPNYGTHLPLKAGIEVLVVFVDGDPDRPLVVGAVHNPVTPNPVVSSDPHKHRVKTASGILIEMRDAFARG
jgi:type VI secretion system secreted protein VgrG